MTEPADPAVMVLAHYLKSLTGGDSPAHSPEGAAVCPICQDEAEEKP